MAEQVKISDIYVPEDRSRKLDRNYAVVLADGFQRDGQFQPIGIRRTPNGKKKFTLVFGEHRLEAGRILNWQEIEAKIVEADAKFARRLEIEENLRRYDLTVLDRAHAVVEMRRLWEEEHGAINPQGGRPKNSDKLSELSDGDREVGTFLASAADRIGVSERAIERLTFIAQKLVPELRLGLHGRAEADNQSALMNAAKCAPKHQKAAAVKLKAEPALSLAEALEATTDMPKPVKDEQTVFYSRAYDTFHRMSPPNRKKLLIELGVPEDIAAKISRRKAKGGDDA